MSVACLLCLAPACVSRAADRRPAVYLGAGMAGRNHPDQPRGDSDNLAVAAGARLPLGPVSLRPEAHAGDHSVLFAPSATFEFALAGAGPGSIDGHAGIGWTFLSERENNVLGDTSSPFVRAGAEGFLVHGLFAGAALMVAPWGYDHEEFSIAGVVYAGARF